MNGKNNPPGLFLFIRVAFLPRSRNCVFAEPLLL